MVDEEDEKKKRMAEAIVGIIVFLYENIVIHSQVYLTYLSSGNNC